MRTLRALGDCKYREVILGILNMNILYKYCEQLGAEKILESLELKLPYISEVNDPLECLPFFDCPNDKSAMKAQWLRTFNRNHINPPADWEQKLNEQFEKGELRKILVESARELQIDWNQRKGCLLSVSKNAQNTVMWAHYADKHKGAAIGIDFDKMFKMHRVDYSEHRPKINVLEDFTEEKYSKTLLTKSSEWEYEREFRTVFLVDALEDLRKQGLACFKDFDGKQTWFLRLNAKSIKEIIFGLYTEEGLKLAVRKLIERAELQHVKLYQTEESETYTLNLVDIKK
jgi:hypothetical protein